MMLARLLLAAYLAALLAAASLLVLPLQAQAQNYPAWPIRIISPSSTPSAC